MAKKSYNVRPRYSSGSPAKVDEATAHRVAEDEKAAYRRCLEGIYGAKHKRRAEVLGLRGIAEETKETRKGWAVHDLITDERYLRPFEAQMGLKKPPCDHEWAPHPTPITATIKEFCIHCWELR